MDLNISNKICPACYYLRYLMLSSDAHGIHSPFVYSLYNNVIHNPIKPSNVQDIEDIRVSLLKKNSHIDVIDLGSGSKQKSRMRRIKDIVKYSVSDVKKCTLLYNFVSYFKPKNIIELGTSFGFTAMYMARANNLSKIYTIEGCSQTLSLAKSYIEELQINNIEATNAAFDTALHSILEECKTAEFIFFDGNHALEPTLKYFNMSLSFSNKDSVFIFDDIHWSSSMNRAWNTIIKHPKVTLSIDLYHFGIVFFNTDLSKQNLTLKF